MQREGLFFVVVTLRKNLSNTYRNGREDGKVTKTKEGCVCVFLTLG